MMEGNARNQLIGCETKRLTASEEILKFALDLAERAERATVSLEEKLSSITVTYPVADVCKNESVKTLPPLFNEFQAHLSRIEASLNRIERATREVELP